MDARLTRAQRGADAKLLRAGSAAVWIATALLVLTPGYRAVGAVYLDRLALPHALMQLTCAFELVLGLRVLLGPASRWVTALQVAMIGAFTLILAPSDPWLMVSPFGVLTKNLPLIASIIAAYWLEQGEEARPYRLLRWAMALIWVSEGLLPKIFFQQGVELDIARRALFGLIEPRLALTLIGLCQVGWGVAALLVRGRWLSWLLLAQTLSLVALPLVIGALEPSLWVHPFGPLTKNFPLIAGTFVLYRRCSSLF